MIILSPNIVLLLGDGNGKGSSERGKDAKKFRERNFFVRSLLGGVLKIK